MKRSKLLIAVILAISGFYGHIYAQQSIYVEEFNGTLTEIPLTNIQKITFSGTDMVLHKTDATSITWATEDVQKYYYDLASNINNIVISETNELLIYPNPSNGNFTVKYQLTEKGFVNISIISIDGRIIKTLLSENKEQGNYALNSNANLETGSYFIKIAQNNNLITKNLIILK